ncbi:MAG TPA: PAS domain-containing protein [Opitutaceae bacterium]|nr:PAS domain-containing protein [Opitutaceae bacterium]
MKRFLRNLPIRHKLMVLTVAISGVALLLACAAFAIFEQAAFRRSMARDFAILADMFGDNVAAGLAFNDPTTIEQTLKTLRANQRIVAACVYDKEGAVIGTYRRSGAAAGVEFAFPTVQPTAQRWGPERLDTFQDITLAGEVIGVVYIGADLGELRERAWRYAGIVSLLLAGCSLVALWLSARFQRIISQPIVDLAQTVAAVTTGKNYAVRAHKESDDELGRLIDGFNEMLTQIQARDNALQSAHDHLEQRVKDRTARLAETSGLLEAMLENSPDLIYFKDRASRFVRFSKACLPNFGLTDAEMLRGKSDADFYTAEHAQPALADEQEIIRTGVPIVAKLEKETFSDGRVAWALTTKMPWRDGTGAIVGTFGISKDVTALKETEDKLAYERDQLRALLDSVPDSIYFKDTQSRFVLVSRSKLQSALVHAPDLRARRADAGLPADVPEAELLTGLTDFATHQDAAARLAFEDEQRIVRTGEAIIGKLENQILRDGMVQWSLTSKMPWRDRAGKIIGTFGISKDITDLKDAEEKLAQLHRQLLETSRKAGMAEVATGVLHNVGNVLNSVNVSATLVSDQVRHSKTVSIAKLAALFDQHKADLAGFLTTDPRGQMIPGYLGTLGELLLAEQAEMLKELAHLRKNVEHIKEIVAMQQSYASASGVIETVSVPDMVEDALRINSGSFARHSVDVFRDYQARPVVTTDKHKVMQILINLLRNAKYACDESGRTDKVITVRSTSDGQRVRIAIIDNGVGIPAENLTRIFSHGFTTRKHGHGFGLHSGALAAKELGGALHVQSEGAGKGAVFTLEIPLAMPQPAPRNTMA